LIKSNLKQEVEKNSKPYAAITAVLRHLVDLVED